MKKIICRYTVTFLFFILSGSGAYADGLGGLASFNYNSTNVDRDGNRQTETRSLNENYYLTYDKSVTRAVSYQLYVRINEFQSRITDDTNNIDLNHNRMIEPGLDVYIRNSFYNFSAGYRRQEDWSDNFSSGDIKFLYPYQLLRSDDRLGDDDRETTELYYARLNFIPKNLPTLTLDYDRFENFDYLSPKSKDQTIDEYSIRSSYSVSPWDISTRYYLNFSHSVNKKPDARTNKIVSNDLNLNYVTGYAGSFWGRRVNYSFSYRGNYSRSDNKISVTETGSFLIQRDALGGFNARGNAAQPDVDFLPSQVSLIDDDFITSTGIDISTLITGQFENLGIRVSGTKSVDTIYVYVNQDVTADVLNNVSNWRAFSSDVNINVPGTWTEQIIQSVSVSAHDIPNSIYRFEIKLSVPVTAFFLKVVNLQIASTANVSVTEIEAYGTDNILDRETTDETDSFTQGLEFRSSSQLRENVTLTLHYSVDRSDRNADSVFSSIGGVFKNIFSDDVSGDDADFRSIITRGYGATASWDAHRLISTSLRLQRSENFDDLKINDFASNSYNLSFNSSPLPTLDATLSLLRSDTFQSGNKENETHSVLMSVGSRLHRDVHMITDAGYTRSNSLTNNTTSDSYLFDGSINAKLNRKLSGSMSYGFLHTSSGTTSRDSVNSLLTVSYRPARLINLSGNFRFQDTDGITTTSERLLVDWIPLPVVRMNFNYVHSNSDASPSRSDTFSSYMIWHITKFADVRFTYTYTRTVDIDTTKTYGYNTYVNCRF
jgi:hypothetical protein